LSGRFLDRLVKTLEEKKQHEVKLRESLNDLSVRRMELQNSLSSSWPKQVLFLSIQFSCSFFPIRICYFLSLYWNTISFLLLDNLAFLLEDVCSNINCLEYFCVGIETYIYIFVVVLLINYLLISGGSNC
jgi:CDK5 regulatory subunit-associated protein 3